MASAPVLYVAAAVGDRRRRRIGYAILAVVLAILCVFPRYYVARAKVLPDSNSASSLVSVFGALGGRMQNFASLFGDRGTVEVALSIARSQSISDDVIARLKLVGPDARYATLRDAQIDLDRKVDVNSLTGGMLEVTARTTDPEWSLQLTRAYIAAISARIGTYGRQQIARKRRVVDERLATSAERLSRAEAALNQFKQQNRLADPQAQLGAELTLRTGLQAQLQAKLVEVQSLRQTAGDENPALRVAETQAAAIRKQLAATGSSAGGVVSPSVSGLTAISLRYANLYRNYVFAQSIYEVYARSVEEVAVQELVTQNSGEVATVDPAHIDAQRYFNVTAIAALCLLALLVFFTEVYVPATGMLESPREADE